MSAGGPALLGTVSGVVVNTGYANKLWSDRYENPNNTLCPLWNGLDQYGRVVCPDSYYTKSPGCESALDRVVVENNQRPQYFEYIALDASGYLSKTALGGQIDPKNTSYRSQTEQYRSRDAVQTQKSVGSTSTQLSNTNRSRSSGQCQVNGGVDCPNGATGYRQSVEEYVDTRANQNFQQRRDLSNIAGWKGNCYACSAGNR